MLKNLRNDVSRPWQTGANLSFFLALLVLIVFVLPSIGFARNNQRLYADAAQSAMLISGAANAWRRRTLFYTVSGLVAGDAAFMWATAAYPDHAFGIWPDAVDLVATAMIILVVLLQVFAAGRVTAARMQGAVAAYVGLGLVWAHAFEIAAKINPVSFSHGALVSSFGNWLYYSFVTLTTLGYGDIVPLSQAARALAMGEALTGQLYLAILLAHLVSLRVEDMGAARSSNTK